MNRERLWDYVDKKGPDDCWEWQLSTNGDGYGNICWYGRPKMAHRVVWEETHGPIPKELEICHNCHNRKCCNPRHMRLDAHRSNVEDSIKRGLFIAKMDEEKVRFCLTSQLDGRTLASMFGVAETTISKIRNRHTWKHVNVETT